LFSSPVSCARRARHSFPTRRSSDLGAPAAARLRDERLPRGDRVAVLAAEHPGVLLAFARQHAVVGVDRVPADLLAPLALLLGRRDRKSTRLNSSHVKISYAVFCLKK